jgi:hypothetical protein
MGNEGGRDIYNNHRTNTHPENPEVESFFSPARGKVRLKKRKEWSDGQRGEERGERREEKASFHFSQPEKT